MIGRHQLPVSSPLTADGILRGGVAALIGGDSIARLENELSALFLADEVVLTDSGTSALIMALRGAVGAGGFVAMPAYSCVDLIAAAIFAGVRVRFYDINPATLSPDLTSVEGALRSGVRAIVVVHLFGYPADVRAVTALASQHGASVIEDSAQGIGGTLDGAALGSHGPLSVLSFGRGKGLTGGRGGALLAIGRESATLLREQRALQGAGGAGWGEIAAAAAQWSFGRPWLYGFPAAIPSLRLGETFYRPAHEPRAISFAAAALVRSGLRAVAADASKRRAIAADYELQIALADNIRPISPILGGVSGYLRFPVLRNRPTAAAPHLGIHRGYPTPLDVEDAAQSLLDKSRGSTGQGFPGARQLARELFTLPTHALLKRHDILRNCEWLR